ncbi:hypothetical protein KP509_01G098200 [Ceratopteris richardii]|uniref:Bifunctional inhibitor/plant lipid transfer protein/seed storage helical domain-containing protein n=1 Tax=Ceratopteris richardii TaxID=49495 RepID=A0A8T2VJI3_CERRI|nr:hypothetical protein KP509_01G098200 [Ceratopteris richardii]KAH7447238.1 hypothetical protein KP509_01G098200 [Ceratopteris richardii]
MEEQKRLIMKAICFFSMVIMSVHLHTGNAQGPSCAPTMLRQLSPCAAFVSPSANANLQPSGACCASLQNVDMNCMCQVINGAGVPTLDRDKALALPQACNLDTSISCD